MYHWEIVLVVTFIRSEFSMLVMIHVLMARIRPLLTVLLYSAFNCRVLLKPDGTRRRTGGEAKGKLANGVGSQYSHTTSERSVSSITNADSHTSAASSRLNWRPRRFKWTRPFRRKTKSGFCASAITFQTQSNNKKDRLPVRRILNISTTLHQAGYSLLPSRSLDIKICVLSSFPWFWSDRFPRGFPQKRLDPNTIKY
jgi:hypothetical protein